MQGDIVHAAKWLAAGLVGAALVCVVGFHPMVTGRVLKVETIEPGVTPRADSTSDGLPPRRAELEKTEPQYDPHAESYPEPMRPALPPPLPYRSVTTRR